MSNLRKKHLRVIKLKDFKIVDLKWRNLPNTTIDTYISNPNRKCKLDAHGSIGLKLKSNILKLKGNSDIVFSISDISFKKIWIKKFNGKLNLKWCSNLPSNLDTLTLNGTGGYDFHDSSIGFKKLNIENFFGTVDFTRCENVPLKYRKYIKKKTLN